MVRAIRNLDKPKKCMYCESDNLLHDRCLNCLLKQVYQFDEDEEIDEDYRERPLPKYPTSALPGSCEKLSVMQLRWERKEQLFHPDDATTSPLVYDDSRDDFIEPDEPQTRPIFKRSYISTD